MYLVLFIYYVCMYIVATYVRSSFNKHTNQPTYPKKAILYVVVMYYVVRYKVCIL